MGKEGTGISLCKDKLKVELRSTTFFGSRGVMVSFQIKPPDPRITMFSYLKSLGSFLSGPENLMLTTESTTPTTRHSTEVKSVSDKEMQRIMSRSSAKAGLEKFQSLAYKAAVAKREREGFSALTTSQRKRFKSEQAGCISRTL